MIESKKAAMTLHTQPYAVSLEKSLGADQIGFAKAPVFGTGKFADSVGDSESGICNTKQCET